MDRGNETLFCKYKFREREKEIVNMIIEGLSNKEISKSLFLSEGTVKNYVSNIYIKTNVRNRVQLINLFA